MGPLKRDHGCVRDLLDRYGEKVVSLLERKKRELEEYNPSGMYPTNVSPAHGSITIPPLVYDPMPSRGGGGGGSPLSCTLMMMTTTSNAGAGGPHGGHH